MSALCFGAILVLIKVFVNPDISDSIGDNFSGMLGSTLALLGMSVAGSVFLIEFLESNAEKDSRYDTISDKFRKDMETCIFWIVLVTISQIAILSVFLMMDIGDRSNMGHSREIIVYLSTWFFCWNCCLILQFDYDLVTVKKRMKYRSERDLELFCHVLLKAIKEKTDRCENTQNYDVGPYLSIFSVDNIAYYSRLHRWTVTKHFCSTFLMKFEKNFIENDPGNTHKRLASCWEKVKQFYSTISEKIEKTIVERESENVQKLQKTEDESADQQNCTSHFCRDVKQFCFGCMDQTEKKYFENETYETSYENRDAISDCLDNLDDERCVRLWNDANQRLESKNNKERLSDPFKLFYTLESILECFVDLPEGTTISSLHKFQAMNRLRDVFNSNSLEDENLYNIYICFRELRDYAVVSELDTIRPKSDDGMDVRNTVDRCMMFCSLFLQNMIAKSMNDKKINDVVFYDNDFENAKMNHSIISNSTLERIDFDGSVGDGSSFTNCRLKDVSFRQARVQNMRMTDIDAQNLNLEKANCRGLKTSGHIVNMKADPYTNLDRWYSEDLNLSYAEVDGSSMEFVRFERCHIYGIDMEHVSNGSSSYRDVSIMEGNFRDVDFSTTEFSEINCDSTDMYDVDMDSCVMRDVRLHDLFVRDAKMERIYWSGLRMINSVVEYACLSGTLNESQISNSEFKSLSAEGLELINCSFNDSVFRGEADAIRLNGTVFKDCRLTDISFENAELENVQFFGVRFDNVCFSSCVMNDLLFQDCVFINSYVHHGSRVKTMEYHGNNIGELRIEGRYL